MRQKNNNELLVKQSVLLKDHSYQIPETGNIGKGLFFGMLISIPLWISFFGWLRIIITFIGK